VGIVLCLLALVQPQNRWFFGFIKIYQSISQNLNNRRNIPATSPVSAASRCEAEAVDHGL
jgi:hypothetical protein